MEKQLKTDCRSFDVDASKGITIEDFIEKYNQIISQLKDKYGYITNIKIHPECGTYNDDEDYYEQVNIKYSRYETDEEFEKRKSWAEYRKSEQERVEIEKMKEYIQSHKNEALEFINDLNKN